MLKKQVLRAFHQYHANCFTDKNIVVGVEKILKRELDTEERVEVMVKASPIFKKSLDKCLSIKD